jgi:phosphonate degradation associated HDIG domain protein
MTKTSIIESIFALYETRRQRKYGEAVTEWQHALQCAALAQAKGEPATLVAACLLHDYGHLLHELGEDIANKGVDAAHEKLGAEALAQYFPHAVVEPIRLHVEAKRYFCRWHPSYVESLSPASQQSLQLQGGVMTSEEAYEFLLTPFYAEALRLRRYDDAAKVRDAFAPPLEHYRTMLTDLLSSAGWVKTLAFRRRL